MHRNCTGCMQPGRLAAGPDSPNRWAKPVKDADGDGDVGRAGLVFEVLDIDGAKRAGLQGWYVDRRRTSYPCTFTAPDLVVARYQGTRGTVRSVSAEQRKAAPAAAT